MCSDGTCSNAMGSGAGGYVQLRKEQQRLTLSVESSYCGLVLTLPGALGKSSLPPLSSFTCHLWTTQFL